MKKMQKGPYSVKGLKSWQAREGIGYQYSLCENGKKVAFVHDEGRGGEIEIDFKDPAARERFDAFLATLPLEKNSFTGEMDPVRDWGFVAELADTHEQDQRFKRQCRTKTLIVLKSNEPDQYTIYKRSFDAEFKALLEKKHGEDLVEIINERFL